MAKAVQLKDKNGNKVFAAPWMPIGSIFLTVSNDNPSKYFGGTWEKISGGFLWGCSTSIDNNLMDSSVGHTKSFDTILTIDQIPSHTHNVYGAMSGNTWPITNTGNDWQLTTKGWNTNMLTYTGGSKGHSHNIPHIGVWVWKRIK